MVGFRVRKGCVGYVAPWWHHSCPIRGPLVCTGHTTTWVTDRGGGDVNIPSLIESVGSSRMMLKGPQPAACHPCHNSPQYHPKDKVSGGRVPFPRGCHGRRDVDWAIFRHSLNDCVLSRQIGTLPRNCPLIDPQALEASMGPAVTTSMP